MQMQPLSPLSQENLFYPQVSDSLKNTIKQALNQPNPLSSCNLTAKQLKQAFEKVNKDRIQKAKLIYHKKQFAPQKCTDELIKQLNLQQQLRKSQMFRFPLHDLQFDYDHYVTIFREVIKDQEGKKKQIWFLVHSWQNVYSLKNWVCDVDIQLISEHLCEQQFDPISHLRDFLGYYNEKWFYEYYKDRQHQKHNIFPRFSEIFSFNSNDHRRMRQIQWYTPQQ